MSVCIHELGGGVQPQPPDNSHPTSSFNQTPNYISLLFDLYICVCFCVTANSKSSGLISQKLGTLIDIMIYFWVPSLLGSDLSKGQMVDLRHTRRDIAKEMLSLEL